MTENEEREISTEPFVSILIKLYSKLAPGVKATLVSQIGYAFVDKRI